MMVMRASASVRGSHQLDNHLAAAAYQRARLLHVMEIALNCIDCQAAPCSSAAGPKLTEHCARDFLLHAADSSCYHHRTRCHSRLAIGICFLLAPLG